MSASLATSGAGALERFHECLLSGASAEMRQDQVAFKKNEIKQQADMRPGRRGGILYHHFVKWSALSSVQQLLLEDSYLS